MRGVKSSSQPREGVTFMYSWWVLILARKVLSVKLHTERSLIHAVCKIFLYFHVLFQFSRSVVFPRCARYLLNVFQAQIRLIVAEIYSLQRLITLIISSTQCENLNRLEKKKYCNNSILLLEHSRLPFVPGQANGTSDKGQIIHKSECFLHIYCLVWRF